MRRKLVKSKIYTFPQRSIVFNFVADPSRDI